MATVAVAVVKAQTKYISGESVPVHKSNPIAAESITSSGTSQQSSNDSGSDPVHKIWVVSVSGGNVWVKFPANPTAAAGDDFLIIDGETRFFGASVDSEKLAVINA